MRSRFLLRCASAIACGGIASLSFAVSGGGDCDDEPPCPPPRCPSYTAQTPPGEGDIRKVYGDVVVSNEGECWPARSTNPTGSETWGGEQWRAYFLLYTSAGNDVDERTTYAYNRNSNCDCVEGSSTANVNIPTGASWTGTVDLTTPGTYELRARWDDPANQPGSCPSNYDAEGPTAGKTFTIKVYEVGPVQGPSSVVRVDTANYSVSVDGLSPTSVQWSSTQHTPASTTALSWGGKLVASTSISCAVSLSCPWNGPFVENAAQKATSVTPRPGWVATPVSYDAPEAMQSYNQNPVHGHELGWSGPAGWESAVSADAVSSGPNTGMRYVINQGLYYRFRVFLNPVLTDPNSTFAQNQGTNPNETTRAEAEAAVILHEADGNPSHKTYFIDAAAQAPGSALAALESLVAPSSVTPPAFGQQMLTAANTAYHSARQTASDRGEPPHYRPPGKLIDFYTYE